MILSDAILDPHGGMTLSILDELAVVLSALDTIRSASVQMDDIEVTDSINPSSKP